MRLLKELTFPANCKISVMNEISPETFLLAIQFLLYNFMHFTKCVVALIVLRVCTDAATLANITHLRCNGENTILAHLAVRLCRGASTSHRALAAVATSSAFSQFEAAPTTIVRATNSRRVWLSKISSLPSEVKPSVLKQLQLFFFGRGLSLLTITSYEQRRFAKHIFSFKP